MTLAFSYLKAGGDEVGTVFYTEVEGVVLESCADMPAHLETIPGSILAPHVIFAEYAQPVSLRIRQIIILNKFIKISIFFGIIAVIKICLHAACKVKLEVEAYIWRYRYSVGNSKLVSEVYRHLEIDELLFVVGLNPSVI